MLNEKELRHLIDLLNKFRIDRENFQRLVKDEPTLPLPEEIKRIIDEIWKSRKGN